MFKYYSNIVSIINADNVDNVDNVAIIRHCS